jgi:hypothetical protein
MNSFLPKDYWHSFVRIDITVLVKKENGLFVRQSCKSADPITIGWPKFSR